MLVFLFFQKIFDIHLSHLPFLAGEEELAGMTFISNSMRL